MRFFTYLLFIASRFRPNAAHDDNLRAGKDSSMGSAQPGGWNGLLL